LSAWLAGEEKKMEVNIIRSETWLNDDIDEISSILEETVKDFIEPNEQIINIESKKNDSGLSRFWIYTMKAC